MKVGMLYHLSLAVVGRVVVLSGGKTPQMSWSPMIPTWTWWCSECAGVLCAHVCVSVPALGGAPPGKGDDSGAGPGACRALALGASWHRHLPLGHDFGKCVISHLFLVSSQQFLCMPTREQPQHRVVVSREMDCRAECEVKSIFLHPFQPYPLIPNLS